MNEAMAGLMQRDALPGPIILKRTDRVISSGVTPLFCYQGHPRHRQSTISIRLKGVNLDIK